MLAIILLAFLYALILLASLHLSFYYNINKIFGGCVSVTNIIRIGVGLDNLATLPNISNAVVPKHEYVGLFDIPVVNAVLMQMM